MSPYGIYIELNIEFMSLWILHCYYTFLSPLQKHRKHAEFFNKRIEMYDDLAVVVGKDMATDSFAKSYIDLDTQQDNGDDIEIVADNGEEGVMDKGEKGKNVVELSTTGSTVLKSHKRGHAPPNDDSVLTDLSDQFKGLERNQLGIHWLHQSLLWGDGYGVE